MSAAGCDLLTLAPPPPPTVIPTATASPEPTATVTPTLGPRQFINAVFCWRSPIDEGEFNLLRFFDDGTLLDATVAPFADCQEAWQAMAPFLIPERASDFGHGEYHLSGDFIRFEVAAPHSSTIVGEASGTYRPDKLVLTKGGAVQEYELVE